jgi:hypothetical protein
MRHLRAKAAMGPRTMKTDQSQMRRPRYMGIPTFMRAPFVDDLSSIDIA